MLDAGGFVNVTTPIEHTPLTMQPAEMAKSSSTSVPSGQADLERAFREARDRFGVDGSGLTVAVIDTGWDNEHPSLTSASMRIVGGYDFAESDDDPDSDGHSHGTAVTSLLLTDASGGNGPVPGADLVALRVYDDDGASDFVWIAEALRWVIEHHETFNISAVNLSTSDGRNYQADAALRVAGVGREVADLIAQLRTLDIPVISAAGNAFDGQPGMGFAAIVPETISVTASDSNGRLLDAAQRLGAAYSLTASTDVAAPGAGFEAAVDGGGTAPVSGTSFAAPWVTSAVVLMQDLYRDRFGALPSVDHLESWLQAGTASAFDPFGYGRIPLLDLEAALESVPLPSTVEPAIPDVGSGATGSPWPGQGSGPNAPFRATRPSAILARSGSSEVPFRSSIWAGRSSASPWSVRAWPSRSVSPWSSLAWSRPIPERFIDRVSGPSDLRVGRSWWW